eukprot:CAMPEP_0176009042 /NCGR_PEP_ID=MMETSP0120_2-20121206/4050_1 /TAXON_ID=160619 /ORGANISM="Kryptoperidinium foliaceum, Strain CCMP 1326" /LENGTH=107 /DNA_ID=CAMNT_0017341833 /DNA_START=381 /DNA_END=700 /DNA_ORIENTATION=-
MMHVVASSSNSTLLPPDGWRAAQVNSWLAYLWHALEIPLHALKQVLVTNTDSVPGIPPLHATIHQGLKKIAWHLSSKRYFVGYSLTLADVSFAVIWKYGIAGSFSCA